MRKNFNERTKRAALARAGDKCEACGESHGGKYDFDHDNPDGLTGLPTLDNCKLLCLPCHKTKTAVDVANIAQAKRREAVQLNVRTDKQKIPQPPKQAKAPRDQLPMPPRVNRLFA